MDGLIFGLMQKGIRQSKFTVAFRVDSHWMMTVPMDELTAPMTNPGSVLFLIIAPSSLLEISC